MYGFRCLKEGIWLFILQRQNDNKRIHHIKPLVLAEKTMREGERDRERDSLFPHEVNPKIVHN